MDDIHHKLMNGLSASECLHLSFESNNMYRTTVNKFLPKDLMAEIRNLILFSVYANNNGFYNFTVSYLSFVYRTVNGTSNFVAHTERSNLDEENTNKSERGVFVCDVCIQHTQSIQMDFERISKPHKIIVICQSTFILF